MPGHHNNPKNKNGKQKNKKNNKNAAAANNNDQSNCMSAPQKLPLLTFGDVVEEQVQPARKPIRNFSSQKEEGKATPKNQPVGPSTQLNIQPLSTKKQKQRRKKSQQTLQYDQPYDSSAIQLKKQSTLTQQLSSVDEGPIHQRQKDELQMIENIAGEENFELLVEPTETQLGSFRVRVEPHCGDQLAGCFIHLEMTYKRIDSMEMNCQALEDTAEGLTADQLDYLNRYLEELKNEGDLPSEIIDKVKDYLGQENPMSRKVLQQQVAEEQEREQEKRTALIQQQRKQAQRRIQEHENTLQREFKDEQLWCQNLVLVQTTNNSQKQHAGVLKSDSQNALGSNSLLTGLSEETKGGGSRIVPRGGDTCIEHVNKTSRYATDFEELEEIGRGGFGIVCKAQHRLDGNIYAIKKIYMSDKYNSRIRREITYLSSLNNQYIVRYFQTWVEQETDPQIIEEFADWLDEEEEDEEYESEEDKSFEMRVVKETSADTEPKSSNSLLRLRSTSLDHDSANPLKRQTSDPSQKKFVPAFLANLQADNIQPDQVVTRSKRAMTENFQNMTPDPKSNTKNQIEPMLPKVTSIFKPIANEKKKEEDVGQTEADDQYEYEYYDEYYDEEMEDDGGSHLSLQHQDSQPTHTSPETESEYKSRFSPNDSEYKERNNGVQGQSEYVDSPREQGIRILYIQMQYCDGETLEEFLQKNPSRTNEKLKWKIYRQILEAVNYLHQREIIHRDIKPENIFLDHNKDVRLGDFGLAKRITPLQNIKKECVTNPNMPQVSSLDENQQTPVRQRDLLEAPSPLINPKNGKTKQLTTGVGTKRFAAPEQMIGNQGKLIAKRAGAAYGFKADIYSLGVVLLDLFRNHDIYLQELNEIHEAVVLREEVLPSLAKQMPEQAVSLIEKMIKKDPEQRPTLLEVLTNDSLPQDEILRKVMPHLRNHKSSVKLLLMRFLGSLEFPKALELQYHGNLQQYYKSLALPPASQKEGVSPGLQQKIVNQKIKNNKQIRQRLGKYLERESIKSKIETGIIRDLRQLFENNGAHDLINLSCISPIPNERTVFLSKPIRLQPWLANLNLDTEHNSYDLNEALCSVIGQKCNDESSRLLTEDYLVQIGLDQNSQQAFADASRSPSRQQAGNGETSIVKPLFDQMIPQGQGSCWQELTIKNMRDLLIPVDVFKLVDERGVVVGLQPVLIDALSRQIASTRSKIMQKMYHIGQTHISSAFAKLPFEKRKLAPKSENHACFALVSPINLAKRKEIEPLSHMSEEELMHEVDALHICDEAFRNSKLASRYKIKVSSSELLDALFEECTVDLADRMPLLKLLLEQQVNMSKKGKLTTGTNQNAFYRHELDKFASRGAKVGKLQELMKIKGSCDQVEKQLQQVQHIFCRPRFATVLEYFRRLEEMLELFDIYSEMPKDIQDMSPTTNTPRGRDYHADQANRSSSRSKNIKTNFTQKSVQYQKSSVQASAGAQEKLIFDFGLLLEQSLQHYSGLFFSVTVFQSRTSKTKSNSLNQEVTLAYGGRFDNNLANFQFELKKYLPAAVGITINCSEFANQAIEIEQAGKDQKLNQNGCSVIDFCIGSTGGDPLITQKLRCMQLLQLEGYRVHVDYSGDMDANLTEQFLQENCVRFVIQLQEDALVLKDRLGDYFKSSQQTFSDVKNLLVEMDKAAAIGKTTTSRLNANKDISQGNSADKPAQ